MSEDLLACTFAEPKFGEVIRLGVQQHQFYKAFTWKGKVFVQTFTTKNTRQGLIAKAVSEDGDETWTDTEGNMTR